MSTVALDSATLREVIVSTYAAGSSAAAIIAAVEAAATTHVFIDPYELAGGELASAVLREEAAAMNPYGAAKPVVLGVADALDHIGQQSLEGTAA